MSGKIFPVSMPKWGKTMEEGKVTDWLISEGAAVNEGDEIVEIETDKISNVVESQTSGILVRHLVVEGSTYKVGSLIGVIIDGDVKEDEIDNFIKKFESEEKIKTDTKEATNKTEKLQVGNLELNFLEVFCEKPEEETIVFVHGFGGDLNSWSYNQVELSTHFNTISLDLPGHGGSALEVDSGNVSELSEILISLKNFCRGWFFASDLLSLHSAILDKPVPLMILSQDILSIFKEFLSQVFKSHSNSDFGEYSTCPPSLAKTFTLFPDIRPLAIPKPVPAPTMACKSLLVPSDCDPFWIVEY